MNTNLNASGTFLENLPIKVWKHVNAAKIKQRSITVWTCSMVFSTEGSVATSFDKHRYCSLNVMDVPKVVFPVKVTILSGLPWALRTLWANSTRVLDCGSCFDTLEQLGSLVCVKGLARRHYRVCIHWVRLDKYGQVPNLDCGFSHNFQPRPGFHSNHWSTNLMRGHFRTVIIATKTSSFTWSLLEMDASLLILIVNLIRSTINHC